MFCGRNVTTKSSPSRLIDTCLRKDTTLFRKDSTTSNADIFATHILTRAGRNNHFTALATRQHPTLLLLGTIKLILALEHLACGKRGKLLSNARSDGPRIVAPYAGVAGLIRAPSSSDGRTAAIALKAARVRWSRSKHKATPTCDAGV